VERPDAAVVLDRLSRQHPGADTELVYRTPFELLIATILSAQTTDQRVNQVTPLLFRRWPDARALASAPAPEVERVIQPTGFFRQKARTIIAASAALVDQSGAVVPADMAALVRLPGVGRKTANVVLGHALGVPGLAVDRHVLRVASRLGIADSDDPDEVERQVTAALPPERWTAASDTLILHGRRVCRPRPLCDRCSAADLCVARATGDLARPPRQAGRVASGRTVAKGSARGKASAKVRTARAKKRTR